MSAAALANIPLAAGSALLSASGALLSATGTAIHWAFGRFMRAPLANSGILAMVTLGAMAGSNALYLQSHDHPSPFFTAGEGASARPTADTHADPALRTVKKAPKLIAPLPSAETTGSVPSIEAPITNDDVKEIQRKLTSMQVFDGAVDGLYGPRTARAIKAFEERIGMKPKGELTRTLLDAVRKAPVILPEPQVEALPTPDALPEPKKQPVEAIVVTPAVETQAPARTITEAAVAKAKTADAVAKVLDPLPAPDPLQLAPQAAAEPVATKTTPVVARELPETPQEAMNIAVETAGDAIDTIIAGVQSIAMTKPGKPAAKVEATPFAEPAASAVETIKVAALPAGTEPRVELASVAQPKVGVTLALPDELATVPNDVAVLETDATLEQLQPAFSPNDPVVVAKVQRALASLGFLQGTADGVAGEATSKAIRNFEVYFNYDVTGRITPDLLDLLVERGATF